MRRSGATQQAGGEGEENDAIWEWRWGPRKVAEIGEVVIGRFIAEFMASAAEVLVGVVAREEALGVALATRRGVTRS